MQIGRLLLSHPTGNANVRQALLAFYEREMLAGFYTTMAWDGDSVWNRLLPAGMSRELMRRSFREIPSPLIHAAPWRELCRVLLAKAGMGALLDAPGSPLSTSGVYRHADRWVAGALQSLSLKAVYAYDGGALESFRAARRCGVKTIYELPTAHTGFKAEFFRQEAELQPEFAQTFQRALADAEWLRRKDEELELSDLVIVPSSYVQSTLPRLVPAERVRIIPYGASVAADEFANGSADDAAHDGAHGVANDVARGGAHDGATRPPSVRGGKLRVLFVGTLSQGKGLSYLLEAVRKVEAAVEFTMIGIRVAGCKPLDAALRRYRWIPSVPHSVVLEEMGRHDVLAFPSLSEGFGLVILEAMSRGMAVITTENTGAVGILRDGVDGFFVPIRSGEALAEKLELLHGDLDLLRSMQKSARMRAREFTWERYRARLAGAAAEVLAA